MTEPPELIPRWRLVYDALCPMRPGEVLTYEHAAEVLDMHPETDRKAIQVAVRRAMTELEQQNLRTLEAARNIGYRVAHSGEHVQLARGQRRKASRALDRGLRKVKNVDLNDMTPEQKAETLAEAQTQQRLKDHERREEMKARRLVMARLPAKAG